MKTSSFPIVLLALTLLVSCNKVGKVTDQASRKFAEEDYRATMDRILTLSDEDILANDSLMYMLSTSYYYESTKFTPPAGNEIVDLALSPDHGMVAVVDGVKDNATLFSYPQLTMIAEIPTYSRPNCVAFNPANDKIAVGTNEGDVNIYNIDDCSLDAQIQVSSSVVRDVEFANNSTIIVCGNDQQVKAFSVARESGLWSNHPHSRNAKSLKLTDDKKYALTASNDGSVAMTDVESGNVYRSFAHGDNYVNSACANHSGTKIYAVGGNGILKVFGMESLSPEFSVTLGEPLASVAVSPDDTTIAIGSAKYVFLVNAENGKVITRIPIIGNTVWSVEFADNDRLVYADNNYVKIVEILSGQDLIDAAREIETTRK